MNSILLTHCVYTSTSDDAYTLPLPLRIHSRFFKSFYQAQTRQTIAFLLARATRPHLRTSHQLQSHDNGRLCTPSLRTGLKIPGYWNIASIPIDEPRSSALAPRLGVRWGQSGAASGHRACGEPRPGALLLMMQWRRWTPQSTPVEGVQRRRFGSWEMPSRWAGIGRDR